MKRKLTVLMAVAALWLAFAAPAWAHVIGKPSASCNQVNTVWLEFFGENIENANLNDHYLRVCHEGSGSAIPDLRAVTDTDPNNCNNAFGVDFGHWSSCINSTFIHLSTSSSYKMCIYKGFSYTGEKAALTGTFGYGYFNLNSNWKDSIKSMRFRLNSQAC